MEFAREREITIAAKTRDSVKAESRRSEVTGPPSRIPTINVGRVISGRVKSVEPGIGTPIRVAMNIRMAIAKVASDEPR